MVRQLIHQYERFLTSHPLLTKSITSGIIAGIGDLGTQKLLEPEVPYSFVRSGKFIFLGTVLVGPLLHVWYSALNFMFPVKSTANIVKKIAADQIIFAPVFLATFFSAIALIENRVDELEDTLRNEWMNSVMASWGYWTPVQAINFTYIPLKYQVLFSNTAAIAWNGYISYASHKEQEHHDVSL